MRRKVVIAAGGTGGHLFPAQRLAAAFQGEGVEVLFVGGGLDATPFFDRSRHSYHAIEAYPWKGAAPGQIWKLLHKNLKGVLQSLRILKKASPHAVIGFGSYHTLPLMAAARTLRKPLFLYEANSVPGKVVSWFSDYAEVVAGQFPGLDEILKRDVQQIAMSGKFRRASLLEQKEASLHAYGLPVAKTVLISGGSQGAEAVNNLACDAVCSTKGAWQAVHLVGKNADVEAYTRRYRAAGVKAVVKPFEEKMEQAWSCADLFMGRSGAGTIAEIVQTCTPALLIPYPYASDGHQEHNARFIYDIGGGRVMLQKDASVASIATVMENMPLEISRKALEKYLEQQHSLSLEEAALQFVLKHKEITLREH